MMCPKCLHQMSSLNFPSNACFHTIPESKWKHMRVFHECPSCKKNGEKVYQYTYVHKIGWFYYWVYWRKLELKPEKIIFT